MVSFELNIRCHVVVVVFCIVNESVVGIPKFFILGFGSQFQVKGKRYEFSMVGHEAITKYHKTVN